jgi:isocitrate dehydrogenase
MAKRLPISVARGDGIGPEIMAAVLNILQEAGAPLEIEEVAMGEQVYLAGELTGIAPSAWDSIRRTHCLLKAPMTTPQGGGYKSLNVTIRTTLGLYANVRPSIAYHPYVFTRHPGMNVVIVRENEEDLYTGIEYRQTQESRQSLKLFTRIGCEKIIRFAFEYARQFSRKKITCFSKDNIMKLTDGLFHQVFDEVAAQYPEIANEHWIVDIGTAKLADTPDVFDVIVTSNLYGDIISDVAAQIAGSVGLAGSANIGDLGAMFEAIHGSAPRRAGQNVANPSGLLMAAILMLVHLGEGEVAERIHHAWLCTLEEGIHTYDIFKEGTSREKVGTREFAHAVIDRLGCRPSHLQQVNYRGSKAMMTAIQCETKPIEPKELVGVDVFVDYGGETASLLAKLPREAQQLKLERIYNRGAQVWPITAPETCCVDQWRCRYVGAKVRHEQIIALLQIFASAGLDFVKSEQLYKFSGKPAYSGA